MLTEMHMNAACMSLLSAYSSGVTLPFADALLNPQYPFEPSLCPVQRLGQHGGLSEPIFSL